jgi:hypothetical protein
MDNHDRHRHGRLLSLLTGYGCAVVAASGVPAAQVTDALYAAAVQMLERACC